VYATILTVSTHHPVVEIPEGPVPPALRAAARQRPASSGFPGYLSGLRYLDESLDAFFSALWKSSLGDRTLVVVLGDHGQRYRPHVPVAEHQIVELMTRIPFAIVTKNQPAPAEIRWPIHQIDVAPTVADIAGFGGRVAWLGRNALDGPGSPWVFAEKERLHYRVADRACYTLQGDDLPTCYRIDARTDPMLTFDLPRIAADPAEVRFFQSIAVAARQAITLNVVMPQARR
jgi:arylsulfatase A-like enzyme